MDNKKKVVPGIIVCFVVLLGIILGVDYYKRTIYMELVAPVDASETIVTDAVPENENISTDEKGTLSEEEKISDSMENTESTPVDNTKDDVPISEETDSSEKTENSPAIIGTNKPSEVYDFCKDQSITDALLNCTVNQNTDHAQDVSVNLGDVFPERYNNLDLDGDGLTDSISRVISHTGDGCIYSFDFGNGISFVSAPYTISPNEGELISFRDFNNDNVDEILITHITDSTGGPIAWNCELYTWSGSGWNSQWAVNEEGIAELAGIDEVLSGEADRYMVRDVELSDAGIMFLIDYGQKDGADITYDLETIQVNFFIDDLYMEERTEKENRQELTDKIWPYGI